MLKYLHERIQILFVHLQNLERVDNRIERRQKKIYIQDIFIVDVKDKLGH